MQIQVTYKGIEMAYYSIMLLYLSTKAVLFYILDEKYFIIVFPTYVINLKLVFLLLSIDLALSVTSEKKALIKI